MTDPSTDKPLAAEPAFEIPEGIRRSKAAIRRDLPELMARWRNRGKWVLYHGDVRVAVGTYSDLIGEVNRLNIPDGEFFVARIRPGAASEEEEDVTR